MNIQKKPKRIRRKDLNQIKNVPKIFMSSKNKIWSPRGFIGRSYSCGLGVAKYSLLGDVSDLFQRIQYLSE